MKTNYYTLNNLYNVAKEKIRNTTGMSDLQKCVLQEKCFSNNSKEASNVTGNIRSGCFRIIPEGVLLFF